MAKPKMLDAIALLKADHRKVEGLFKKFEAARNGAVKKALAKEICTELSVHTMIEEEIFYPACRPGVEEDQMDEAYVEHDGAKVMIAELLASSQWQTLLPETKLTPHTRHFLDDALVPPSSPPSHLRLNIFPDGGVSRLRVWGQRR